MAAAPLRKNSMMAMLDAKPEARADNGQEGGGRNNGLQQHQQQQQLWGDGGDGDQLSPLRKHLISTYLQVSDEEAMPLSSEYFGVALSFVALGALVRSSNLSKRKQRKGSPSLDSLDEEERLDMRSCSRFERMALESMLREAMERLGALSQNAYQLEARVRDLVDENVARDREKVALLKRMADADKVVQDLKALRKAEGRANERVMCIVAAKEQDWLKEKRNLQKEVEKLKETVSGMTREAKFQARRCRNALCEHCKGIDRVVRNTKGRISLRELHNFREVSQAHGKRDLSPKLIGRPSDAPKVDHLEMEEDRVLMKAIELKKKHRENQSKVERLQSTDDEASSSSQFSSTEFLLRQQHDMESELASILKRVGILKQKSYLGPVVVDDMQPVPQDAGEALDLLPSDDRIAPEHNEEEKSEKSPVVAEPNMHDPTLEVADYASDQADADLVEFEKAFELRDDEETSAARVESNHSVSDEAFELRGEDGTSAARVESTQSVSEKAFELRGEEETSTPGVESNRLVAEKALEPRGEEETSVPPVESNHSVSEKAFEPRGEDEDSTSRVESDHSVAEKAFELWGEEETFAPRAESNHSVSKNAAGDDRTQLELERPANDAPVEDDGISRSTAGELQQQEALDVDDELVTLPESLSQGDGVALPELGSESSEGPEEDTRKSAEVLTTATESADLSGDEESLSSIRGPVEFDAQEQEPTKEPSTNVPGVRGGIDGVGLPLDWSLDDSSADAEEGSFSVEGRPESSSAESGKGGEQVVGVVDEDEETIEFSDALSSLDPLTCLISGETHSSAAFVSKQSEHDHAEYDTDMEVKENWGFEDSLSSPKEEEGLMENQDIPVFERNDVDDDLAGELPEPEEKRVCGLETTNELPVALKETSRQEEAHFKEKDNNNGGAVVSQPEDEDPFVEKIGLVADVKPKSDAVKVVAHS